MIRRLAACDTVRQAAIRTTGCQPVGSEETPRLATSAHDPENAPQASSLRYGTDRLRYVRQAASLSVRKKRRVWPRALMIPKMLRRLAACDTVPTGCDTYDRLEIGRAHGRN